MKFVRMPGQGFCLHPCPVVGETFNPPDRSLRGGQARGSIHINSSVTLKWRLGCAIAGLFCCLSCLPATLLAAERDSPGLTNWRRLDISNPRGGPPLAALMQVADLAQSDEGLAGMMVRCRDRVLETVVVILDPLPPKEQVDVVLSAGGASAKVVGTPIITGAGLAVPVDLPSYLNGSWANEPNLEVRVAAHQGIRGVVPLAGLKSKLALFGLECTSQSNGGRAADPSGP